MSAVVDLDGVRDLLGRGAQLVEVLPREEYEELHLPGAINLPLKELTADRARTLDQSRPVVVYCWDALCDMSPRAAVWLGSLGFDAYDYTLSKIDWMAHGLPMEGTAATRPTARSLLRDDVPTCRADQRADEITRIIDSGEYRFALVRADRVVLGRVRRSRLADVAADATADQLMEPGPSTIRPHTEVADLAASFERSGGSTLIVTTPGGELLGAVHRDDLSSA